MRKIVYLIAVLISLSFATSSSMAANKEKKAHRYDIECAGTGTDGNYLVKVWSYVGGPKKATTDLVKKNAVHGVIFRGFSGSQGCTSQRPIVKSPAVEEEKSDFFSRFFADGGAYSKYASLVGVPEIHKIGKEYKVGYVVTVSKDMLRKDLEDAGIVKGLSSNF